MWDTLAADLRATIDPRAKAGRELHVKLVAKAAFAPQVHAVLLFRVSSVLARTPLRPLAFLLRTLAVAWSGAEIHPDAKIGPGFALVHSVGVVINGATEIGEDCRISQGVTIAEPGRGGKADRWGVPVLGDHVTVGAHAVVVGPVHVGDGAVIGANSVVTQDVPEGAVVAGSPARVIGTAEHGAEIDFEASLRRHRTGKC